MDGKKKYMVVWMLFCGNFVTMYVGVCVCVWMCILAR